MTGRREVDIDLFAGPGGWDEGVRALGVRPIGYEWAPEPCRTARAAGHERQHVDLSTVDPKKAVVSWGDYLRLKIGSPPCEGFSFAGAGRGRDDALLLLAALESVRSLRSLVAVMAELRDRMTDPRSILVLEPLRWALATKPQAIAWEQVPTVLPLWEACAAILQRAGYSVATGKLHAEQYGVPQARIRAVLVARRDGTEARLPVPTHSRYHRQSPTRLDDGVLPWVSMAQALGSSWTPVAANDGTTADDMAWVGHRPSPTIVGSFSPDVIAAPGYRQAGDGPRQKARGSVRVTLEQAAILQSFPANYPWAGSTSAQWRQVGDAVPPLLARAIVAELLDIPLTPTTPNQEQPS